MLVCSITVPPQFTVGEGKGPIHFTNFMCNGTEQSITECSFQSVELYASTCDHSRDIHLACQGKAIIILCSITKDFKFTISSHVNNLFRQPFYNFYNRNYWYYILTSRFDYKRGAKSNNWGHQSTWRHSRAWFITVSIKPTSGYYPWDYGGTDCIATLCNHSTHLFQGQERQVHKSLCHQLVKGIISNGYSGTTLLRISELRTPLLYRRPSTVPNSWPCKSVLTWPPN